MTTLKGAISAANSSVAALRPPSFLPHLRAFELAAAKSVEPFESLNAKPPEGADYDGFVRKARKNGIAYSSGGSGFTLRELRLLAWALWLQVDGECIAKDSSLLSEYLRAVTALKKRSHFRALAGAYLWNYRPDGLGFPAVAKALRKLLEIAPSKWGERHRRWDIFAGSGADRMVARHFMSAGSNEQAIAEAAKRIGLEKLLAHGGMSRAAFRIALQEYADVPNLETLRQLTAWRKFAAKGEEFCNSDYAECFLLPWTKRTPSQEMQSVTLRALLDSHKDPRMHKVRWAGVREDAQKVIFRWLVGASLEQFFYVIDQASHGMGEHMWPERRKFWLAYYKRGALSDAWVAFSRAGLRYLRGDRDVGYAQLGGALYNHAVLLVQIGNLIIADWNQNGMCRIWKQGNRHAPQFHQRYYSANQLRRSGDTEPFRHDPHGRWRGRVAEYIKDEAGVDISPREYL